MDHGKNHGRFKLKHYKGSEGVLKSSNYEIRTPLSIGIPGKEKKPEQKKKQLMITVVVGLGWRFGILEIPLSNTPFHKGILGIQTTGPQTSN